MGTRVGIELSPTACRIVEVDGGLPWRKRQSDTRVGSFAVLPPSGPETREKLESLRRRHAAVIVWGGRSEHRQVMVTAGSYESMRAEALASLAAAGLQTSGVWADIAPATSADDKAARRPVIVSMASASELVEAIQPLREAGIRIRTVTTPAVALGSLARLRQAFAEPGAIEAYVALDEQATCIALVRSGVLLAARDLAWGFIDQNDAHSEPRSREDITAWLAESISEFVAAIGGAPGDIGQVCVCGGLPELRSMAAALMARLDVEVEPLDSLFAIDAARLPEPADEFRERGAELRLAWSVAADWPPAINLLRARRRQVSKTWLARAAVVAGAAAGLGGSWWIVERSHWLRAPKLMTRTASTAPTRGNGPARVTPPPPIVTKAPAAVPPPAVVNKAPAVAIKAPDAKAPVISPPPAPTVSKAPVVAPPPPVAANKAPAVPPPVAVNKAPAVSPPVVVNKAPVVPTSPAAVSKAPVVAPPVGRALLDPAAAGPKGPALRTETKPPATVNKAPVVPPPPVVVNKAPVVPPPAVSKAPAVVARPPAAVTSPPAPVTTPPVVAPPAPVTRAPVLVTPPPLVERAPAIVTPPVRTEPSPARVKPAPPPEVALPFDAALGTILYSSDRKLAIIDNRIVGVGDEVRGARVIEITASAVMLRDEKGRLRRLALGAGGR